MRLALFGLALLARAANAGDCGADYLADELDHRASQAKPRPPTSDFHLCLWWDVPDVAKNDPKMTRRMLSDCEKILLAAPGDELCSDVAAVLGKDVWGKTDIVATLAPKVRDFHVVDFLAATKAPRAAPFVMTEWKRQQPIADAKPNDPDVQNDWAAWRVAACGALGALGDDTAKQFLTDQLGQKIDRGVKRAAIRAIAVIDARRN
ncbi:MAG TPA: HEAT repeat domain-containing protein [Kofleriaceae bacterium]